VPARGGDTQGRGEQRRAGGNGYLAGVRAGLAFGMAMAVLGVSFGVLARSLDWGVAAPIVFPVITFSGSAQFAAAAVLGAGGGVVPAVVAAWLLIARFLPMGIAVDPYLKGGPLRRALRVARGQWQRPSGLPLQTAGMLVFGSTVLVALFYVDPDLGGKLVGIAILGHAAWDAYHFLRNRVVPRSYAEFCIFVDLLVGAAILFMT
jgi:hypothetical protein